MDRLCKMLTSGEIDEAYMRTFLYLSIIAGKAMRDPME